VSVTKEGFINQSFKPCSLILQPLSDQWVERRFGDYICIIGDRALTGWTGYIWWLHCV